MLQNAELKRLQDVGRAEAGKLSVICEDQDVKDVRKEDLLVVDTT